MNKYKHQISDQKDDGIWVCNSCRKANNALILKGKWKLIDRCSNSAIPCDVCGGITAEVGTS